MTADERLFFALWPSPEHQQALAGLAAGRGRPVPRRNIHLTLVFLGATGKKQRSAAQRVADGIRVSPFDLTLGRLDVWRRSRILWSGPVETPPELTLLAGSLARGLTRAGFDLDPRPFRAHVTLARNVTPGGDRAEHVPVFWPVADFCLVRSETGAEGARYEVLARWPLSVQ